jgi:hypothetical protein
MTILSFEDGLKSLPRSHSVDGAKVTLPGDAVKLQMIMPLQKRANCPLEVVS